MTATPPSSPDDAPLLSPDGSLLGPHHRITPLTPRVVRLEWSPTGEFEDRPSTFALHRPTLREGVRAFREGDRTVLETDCFRLEHDGGPFTANGVQLQVRGGISAYHSVWRPGQDLSLPAHQEMAREGTRVRALDGNLGGAARTLDEADGRIPLEPGINSTVGYAVLDDSGSMVFDADGRLVPREAPEGQQDLYAFAGGWDHIGNLRDFYAISGPQPLLPRFALGNWWSRYHRYSADEYLQVMDRFQAERLPFSVAVIDMDWHLTDVDPKYGSGWTGYTWNRELFPDPAAFQAELHRRGLAVTLNVHPADGVRAFEDAYGAMCEALGREADGEPIVFDPTDPAFMDAYFSVLHRGLEELGTDFWWVDWQSGPYSRRAGTDPLWVLNHGHFEDNRHAETRAEHPHRPLTFSRYAGPGSHRYPVGFSGDSIVTWESLAFQPEFTAAGANIGYGWWSHDIGGHMEGYRDDELATRWVQFGVFSPITRLHSSNSPFAGKEPWNYRPEAEAAMAEHLRLRHRMFPYLHSMNHRAHHEGRPLVEPMYFAWPCSEAYENRGQYAFGSELVVAPIVRPAEDATLMARADVFVPEGRWVDVFTGLVYDGGRALPMHRDLATIPVLLRAGGFWPLAAESADPWADGRMPDLDVMVAGGASGRFTLREEPEDGTWTATAFSLDAEAAELRVEADGTAFGASRSLAFTVVGIDPWAFDDLACDGARARVEPAEHGVRIVVQADEDVSSLVLRSRGFTTRGANDVAGRVRALLQRAQCAFSVKQRVMAAVERGLARGSAAMALAEVASLGTAPTGHQIEPRPWDRVPDSVRDAVAEVLGAAG